MYTDNHRHPAGKVATLRLLRATITIVYITATQMNVMAQCGGHHALFHADPQWPTQLAFQAYVPTCATKAGRPMPEPKDIDQAYKAI